MFIWHHLRQNPLHRHAMVSDWPEWRWFWRPWRRPCISSRRRCSDGVCSLLEVCGVVVRGCLNMLQSVVEKQPWRASYDPSGNTKIFFSTTFVTLTRGLYAGINKHGCGLWRHDNCRSCCMYGVFLHAHKKMQTKKNSACRFLTKTKSLLKESDNGARTVKNPAQMETSAIRKE